MNTDIRVAVSFRGHRKRKRLKLLIGPEATDHLLDLWLSTAMNHPTGTLVGMDATDIALEAGWPGDPAEFVNALVDCRLLDKSADGTYVLHDWADHQAYVVHADERKERARQAARKRWGSNGNADSMPAACPEHAGGNAPSPAPSPTPSPTPRTTPSQELETVVTLESRGTAARRRPAHPGEGPWS